MKTKYTVDFFIKKFSKIPRSKWCIADLTNDNGQHCAYGHCGGYTTTESIELTRILGGRVIELNDYSNRYGHLGKHPRTRILNALRRVKKGLSYEFKS